MVFVQSRIAMLDIYMLAFDLLGIAAFLHGFRKQKPDLAFGLAGLAFGLATACKWSGLFPLAVCIGIIAAIRLLQGWRTQFEGASDHDWYRPDRWPDFRYLHFAACFVLIPAVAYFATFVPLYGFSVADILEAQRRIFTENAGFHPPHPYMSSWPSWPLLMRPIWYQFDKLADDRVQAIIFLGNPLILWPALAALGICLRDWIVTRRADAFLIAGVLYRAMARMGDAAPDHRIHLLLFAVRDDGDAGAGLCADAGRALPAALAVMGLRRGRVCRFRDAAADLRGGNRNVDAKPITA